jgi:hypothetical protein
MCQRRACMFVMMMCCHVIDVGRGSQWVNYPSM